ncbi:MAG: hypothetical protein WBP82_03875 [Leuconostoc mesenteroides]
MNNLIVIFLDRLMFLSFNWNLSLENIVLSVLAVVSLIGNIYQLKHNKSEIIHKTDTKTVASQEKLLENQDKEIHKLKEDYEELKKLFDESELGREALRSEYKVLVGIDIKEILNFSALKTTIELQHLEIVVLTEELRKSKSDIIQLKMDAK